MAEQPGRAAVQTELEVEYPNDGDFLAAFEGLAFPASRFRHRDHLRAAWAFVSRLGADEAEVRVSTGIRLLARAAGAEEKYHETLTRGWVRAVAHFASCRPSQTFEGFVQACPQLLRRDLLLAHYRADTLFSAEARTGCPAGREPDPYDMTARRPLAVLVGGAPGSGKTTIAGALGTMLRIPVVHKDRLRDGRWRTLGRATDLGTGGVELFYRTIEFYLGLGVSVVGDMTFWRGLSEPEVAARFAPLAELVNVHCRALDAVERFERRMRADPLCPERRLDVLLPLAANLQHELFEPLDFACRTIVVDTTDGYVPSVENVAAEIDRLHTGPSSFG